MTIMQDPIEGFEKVGSGGLYRKDNRHFRLRRGKMVEIPPEWLGKVTDPQSIRRRKDRARVKVVARRRRARKGL